MIREIIVEELENLENPILVDVRSEGEYQEATIPGALNLPLLNNEERAQVGTTYTQTSPALAREEGLKFISPKLPDLIKQAQIWSEQGPLVLFCWRGGMRSKSLASVLDLMGVPVYRLQGGYKSYRKNVVEFFEQEPFLKFVVLRGNTGVGKTEILKQLKSEGYPSIDLEKLANNRGSVFGDVGLGAAPSQKKFEALLYEELREIKDKGYSYIIVECESKRIGRVTLPVKFYNAMQQGTQILVYDSIPNRVKRLVQEYTEIPDSLTQIREALIRLAKTLGHKKLEQYNLLLEENRLADFTQNLLEYYDALYGYPNESSLEYEFELSQIAPDRAIQELKNFLDKEVAVQIGISIQADEI
ncbi:tRNA 2-selenouridine(34) synthase MnmH [Desulfitobacterium metallireducens]|uniref:tRNA 2-selenouridine synthase n=1 Tax=Desulfitobacterium metallireducens DSM 15288 TaxID=871968 RepID=W0E786_9FIRM|nr:tRNA 2-selenouridine(34) synthase MnmH [Desulfitobacterium metallireducens]AHF06637.1 tRNA 2-selenouridine synthase [Desulfitobacterium metallireducens DSM 15288]